MPPQHSPSNLNAIGFPILNEPALLDSPKGRKTQDVERIGYSSNSEDWVTWELLPDSFESVSHRMVGAFGQRGKAK